jgi:hypothetical protein
LIHLWKFLFHLLKSPKYQTSDGLHAWCSVPHTEASKAVNNRQNSSCIVWLTKFRPSYLTNALDILLHKMLYIQRKNLAQKKSRSYRDTCSSRSIKFLSDTLLPVLFICKWVCHCFCLQTKYKFTLLNPRSCINTFWEATGRITHAVWLALKRHS